MALVISLSIQEKGSIDFVVGEGRSVQLTSSEMKLLFEADKTSESNYCAQADGDVCVLLDGLTSVKLPFDLT